MALHKIKWEQEPGLREKVFFGALLVASLYFFAATLWMPLSDRVRAVREEGRNLEGQADGIQKLLDLTREQMAKMAEQDQKPSSVSGWTKKVLERRVSDVHGEVNKTIDLLAHRGFSRRIKVRRVDTGDRTETPNYTMVPFQIEIDGPYTGVQSYLEAVERLERAIVVRKLAMRVDEARAGSLVTTVDAELYVAKR